jgi:hypothetical protein
MAGITALYATLLASPEAAIEISEESGVELLATLMVTTTGRDGFIHVKATAGDPEGATKAALYSFTWLEQRLVAPPSVVRLDQSEVEPAPLSVLDEKGQFLSTIRLEASPVFTETAASLWIGLTTSESVITVSLADAGEQMSEYATVLEPDSEMTISLEDVFGNELDAINVPIPPLPEPETAQYALVVRLDRGILYEPTTEGVSNEEPGVPLNPNLLERHVDVSWQRTRPGTTVGDDAAASDAVGLLLLTEAPISTVTGTRRGPLLLLAALVGGFFGLLVLIVAIDTWTEAKRQSEAEEFVIAALPHDEAAKHRATK